MDHEVKESTFIFRLSNLSADLARLTRSTLKLRHYWELQLLNVRATEHQLECQERIFTFVQWIHSFLFITRDRREIGNGISLSTLSVHLRNVEWKE